MKATVHFAMLTDPGRIRPHNQDACAADHEAGIYVVCDGMGGAAGGEVASRMAADVFMDTYENTPGAPLDEVIHAVNAAVYRRSVEDVTLNGMGTTLVAMVLEPGPGPVPQAVRIAHVGDSRAYLWRAGQLHQLTEDHSLVEEQFRAGQLTRAEADQAPYRNIITRAIGSFGDVVPELVSCPVEYGDLFLLATDGLVRELDDDAIAGLLRAHAGGDLLDTCNVLIDAANDAGGNDNITVLLLHID